MQKRLSIRSEVDFIALAPVLLGFQPENSLVMLTITSFTARVDIPQGQEAVESTITALLEPSVRHNVEKVAFVIYGDTESDLLTSSLLACFNRAGITILAAVQYMDGRYRPFDSDEWQEVDIASHPLTLDAKYQDLGIKHQTRAQMVESIKPQAGGWDEATRQAVERLQEVGVAEVIGKLERKGNPEVNEALWCSALRGAEEGSDLARDIAIVLAWASWLKGDGAQAWAALDLADQSSPWYALLESVIQQGVSPDEWPG